MKPLVLIVESKLVFSSDIKEILSEEGYEVVINIVNVEDAITAVENLSPELVLIDVNLNQDQEGIDLGTYLLKKDTIPFIYITSYVDKITLERDNDTRPYGFLVKPFKAIELKTTVSIVLNNFKYRNVDVPKSGNQIKKDIPYILRQTIAYINQNINNKIKISDLLNQTNYESQHFDRLFTKYVGTTPHKYIIDKKIEKAKELLVDATIPITKISIDLGFKSHGNFCVQFKKATGRTPKNFRLWRHETTGNFGR
jgi:AraC-like DNA-binding protein